jgi:hypothetical protein
MNPNTKELIINVTIGLLVVVALVFAYFIFVPEGDNKVKQAFTRTQDATTGEIITVGSEVAGTITELRALQKAVLETTQLFNSNIFANLRDFSVPIPAEAVGRDNPFVPTEWKLKAIAADERARAVRTASPSF